jgi:hypothetical protein
MPGVAEPDASLGVSTALYLGAEDVLKLRASLTEHADAPAEQLRVLNRLASVPMTRELCNNTRIDEAVAQLHACPADDVRALAERVSSAWVTQLREERQQRERKAQQAQAAAPKAPKRPRGGSCPACAGQHRAHTCNRETEQ